MRRTTLRVAWPLIALSFALAPAGCTVAAGWLLSQPAPCEADADCLAGSACTDGICQTQEPPGTPLTPAPEAIGPEGGTVRGPDGTELVVPAGAVRGFTEIEIERLTSTFVPDGVDARSATYAIRPQLELDEAATFSLPLDAAACPADCRLWRRTVLAPTFVAIDGSGRDGDRVSASLDQLGDVVAGLALAPRDGGTPDGGPEPGDGGVPPGLFQGCDFGPGSCPSTMACAPNPFASSGDPGICLVEDPSCGPSCACCGNVTGLAGASWCLPTALCGDGALGEGCDAGPAGCDRLSTSACVDPTGDQPGPGARLCTAPCTSESEDAVCSGGCCLPHDDAPEGYEGYCAPTALCARPLGAACLTDDGCASATCRDVAPGAASDEPKRCTQGCAITDAPACGLGLCCFPSDCAGAGWCAPEGLCTEVAQTEGLLCTNTCTDDDACGSDHCDRGTCVDAAACECTDHDDCGPGEHCRIDGAARAVCESSPDDPCCGVCTLTTPPACFADQDCAADGGPPDGGAPGLLCQADVDAGCLTDPYGQCPGRCETFAPEACSVDDDCPSPRRCVDHRCL